MDSGDDYWGLYRDDYKEGTTIGSIPPFATQHQGVGGLHSERFYISLELGGCNWCKGLVCLSAHSKGLHS